MRFALPHGTDPLAVRLALAACRDPLRLERRGGARAFFATERDAAGTRRRWLRAGLEPSLVPDWPDAVAVGGGILEAEDRRWCIGRASLGADRGVADVILRLAPVSRDDALRAIARALVGRMGLPFRWGTPPLARAAARIACGADGVVAARAYVMVSAPTRDEALRGFRATSKRMRPSPRRLRVGALAAWRDIREPSGGAWRALGALEPWWS